jgi:hypothetical protein
MIKCGRVDASHWKDIVKQKGKFFQAKQKDPIDCQAGVHRPLLP